MGRRAPRLWFSSNHPHVPSICLVLLMICPLTAHGWFVVMVFVIAFQLFFLVSSLNVHFKDDFFSDKPVCVENQRNIYGVSEGEKAHITCKVDAFPEAESFSWSYNTTSGIVNSISLS